MTNNLIRATINIIIATLLLTSLSYADEVKVPIYETSLVRQGKHVGYIVNDHRHSRGLEETP